MKKIDIGFEVWFDEDHSENKMMKITRTDIIRTTFSMLVYNFLFF